MWLNDWEIHPGDYNRAKIEEGLEHSRVLVLCMSANAFGSNWAQSEAGTFRFRDPLNKQRRFIPLRLDDAPIKGSLGQFHYIKWLHEDREQEYAKLLEACRPPAKPNAVEVPPSREQVPEQAIEVPCRSRILACAFSRDGRRVLIGTGSQRVLLLDVETRNLLGVL